MSNQTPGATKARMSHNWMSGLYQVREKLKGRNIVKEITNSVSFYLPTNFKKNKEKKSHLVTFTQHTLATHAVMEIQDWMDVENETQEQ